MSVTESWFRCTRFHSLVSGHTQFSLFISLHFARIQFIAYFYRLHRMKVTFLGRDVDRRFTLTFNTSFHSSQPLCLVVSSFKSHNNGGSTISSSEWSQSEGVTERKCCSVELSTIVKCHFKADINVFFRTSTFNKSICSQGLKCQLPR